VTASDFHKTLRTLTEQQKDNTTSFRINDLAQQINIDKAIAQEHLHTLETLGLIEYLDREQQVFSLTESGKLANLP